MQLSIILPTHRHDLLALSRIAQVCSWASSKIQVIVRDNSGNAQKREMLKQIRHDNCTIVSVDECEPRENFVESLKLAKGAFVFLLADDDMCFDRAIAALPGIIDRIANVPSFVGIAGPYVVEASSGSVVINYKAIDSADPAARVAGYLAENGPNVLFYAVLRRDTVKRMIALVEGLPIFCSFHDQVLNLLYLLNGKYHLLPRIFYLYDFGEWENAESAQKRDLEFYTQSGLDPAVNLLHWFLCGFEGAVLTLHSDAFPAHPPAQRQAIANQWFSTMYARFKGHKRLAFGSPHAAEIEKSCARLQAMAGTVNFDVMLAEIKAALALFSTDKAQLYFDYWNALLTRQKPAVRAPASPALSVAAAS